MHPQENSADVRALLPPCRHFFRFWGNDAIREKNPHVGLISGIHAFAPLWGRQASHPASRRAQKNRAEARTHLETEVYLKDRKMSIRISDADLQQIHDRASQAGMTLTEYVTACCLGKRIIVVEGLEEVIRQQKGIGRNLNQLTTLANMGKIRTVSLRELSEQYAQVSSLLADLLRKGRWK